MHIKINQRLTTGGHEFFGVGYLTAHREGTCSADPDTGVLSKPTMKKTATVFIGPTLGMREDSALLMTSRDMRALAGILMNLATRMDTGVDLPHASTLLVNHPDTGDCYFTGDLVSGKALIRKDRWDKENQFSSGRYRVSLYDDPECTFGREVEFGVGHTLEEAWRYALGAAFGPLDAEYDEAALLSALKATSAD